MNKAITKDWKGNEKSVFVCNGASNHSDSERQVDDYYATDPIAIHKLCNVEKFSHIVFEPAAGGGHLVNALKEHGYEVIASDIVDRTEGGCILQDFFTCEHSDYDIITNPPYKFAKEFIEHAVNIVDTGRKVAMFLKLTFLEGKARQKFFKENPPKKVWVFSERILCAKNGDFEGLKASGGSAVAYAWFVWEKGYKGETTVGWI